jgi:hypothetical protein
MKVKILPFNYIGHIVEQDCFSHRPARQRNPHYCADQPDRDGGMIYAKGNTINDGNG